MISYEVERLIHFGLKKSLITQYDVFSVRNSLMELFQITEPYQWKENETIEESHETVCEIMEKLLEYCRKKNLLKDDSITQQDLMDAKIMGILMPRGKEVNNEFQNLYEDSPEKATDYFYNLSKNSNYIQVNRIQKNRYWTIQTEFGNLEITINLSKPEKDPKEIAAAKNTPQSGYPKCLLCKENEGYGGNAAHPARQNLRLVHLELNQEPWFMQYSPYSYYNEHCIVLHKDHIPMKTTEKTFRRLLDFVEYLPHYFIGSNADIPIVGGSILTHDHYQGGNHTFPMEMAKPYRAYTHQEYGEVNISLVKWPLSVIRISGKNKNQLVKLSMHIMESWKKYEDLAAEIIPFTDGIRHNAITPIARINDQNCFELDLVLRNNRTNKSHPLGIFHPHEEFHHIKKENIGLIEVMGLAVLPGRLEQQLKIVEGYLSGSHLYSKESLPEEMMIFSDWIESLINQYGIVENAQDIIRKEVSFVFLKVLQNAGVFQYNENGKKQFHDFMMNSNFQVKETEDIE